MEDRLLAMGRWLSVNGESIYGSQAFDLVKNQHDWGKITSKQQADGSTRLYLHVYNWPLNHKLPVTGIKEKPVKAYLLSKPDINLPFSSDGILTRLELPAYAPDPLVSVVVLEYASYPSIEEGLIAQSVYGGFSLTPKNALKSEGNTFIEAPGRRGTIPAHIQVKDKSTYQWWIYLDKAVTLNTDVSYAYQGKESKGKITIRSGPGSLSAKFKPSGRFVGEPNSNWQIDSFNSNRLGQLVFSEPGFYDITLEIKPGKGEELSFQWLWLGME
jgi:alpha-L-fucosidase